MKNWEKEYQARQEKQNLRDKVRMMRFDIKEYRDILASPDALRYLADELEQRRRTINIQARKSPTTTVRRRCEGGLV